MKKIVCLFLTVILLNGFISVININAMTTADKEKKCIDLVNSAIAHIKKIGADKAYADFSAKDNNNWKIQLSDDMIYVFVNNYDGITLAHGAKPQLVGKNLLGLKDTKGKQFFLAFLNVAKSNAGSGWVEYYWQNPKTKKDELKRTYIKKIPGIDAYIGAGFTK